MPLTVKASTLNDGLKEWFVYMLECPPLHALEIYG
jgi:hypothetical protein